MAEAKHFCADCETHFRSDPEVHADVAHDGGWFRGIENGNFRDWERQQQFKINR